MKNNFDVKLLFDLIDTLLRIFFYSTENLGRKVGKSKIDKKLQKRAISIY